MVPQTPRSPETPSKEELLERVARLERLLLEKDGRIAELERLLEQSRRGGKRQALPPGPFAPRPDLQPRRGRKLKLLFTLSYLTLPYLTLSYQSVRQRAEAHRHQIVAGSGGTGRSWPFEVLRDMIATPTGSTVVLIPGRRTP
jgi:hypothetical protein